jgi:hypothetical protein
LVREVFLRVPPRYDGARVSGGCAGQKPACTPPSSQHSHRGGSIGGAIETVTTTAKLPHAEHGPSIGPTVTLLQVAHVRAIGRSQSFMAVLL